MHTSDVVEISATGTAYGPYDRVFFKTSIIGQAPDGPQAKKEMNKDLLEALILTDAWVEKRAVFNRVLSTRVTPIFRVDGTRSAYHAITDMTFESGDMSLVNEIHDALTLIPNSTVAAPVYSVSNLEILREKALANAWLTVSKRFEYSARLVLGLDPKVEVPWSPVFWHVDYGHTNTVSKVSNSVSSEFGALGQDGGLASVSVTLTVSYRQSV